MAMKVFWEIIFEMGVVLLLAQALAAIWALPLWMAVTIFLWTNVTYLSVFYFTSAVMVGICIGSWMIELTKGVNL